jgi:hypothetical protein
VVWRYGSRADERGASRRNAMISLALAGGSGAARCVLRLRSTEMTSMTNVPKIIARLALATATLSACATTPLRSEASTSEIRAAEEVGAEKVPKAALHLQLAKEELAAAQALSANGEPEKAASMLTRAQADAELAVALSRQDSEKKEALEAMARVRELRSDNEPLEADTASTER